MNEWRHWFQPRRDWQGRAALVPVDTCYRILDLYSWSFALMGTLAVGFVWLSAGSYARYVPVVWAATSVVALQWVAVILRGLPFLVRYGVFAAGLMVFLVCAVGIIGITPNWMIFVLLLVSSAGLLFGARAGALAIVAIVAVHGFIAWGWIAGWLPFSDHGTGSVMAYTDFRQATVWVRVLVIGAVMMGAMQLLMRYVLGDMNRALARSREALQLLREEQERRERNERKFSAVFNDSPDMCGLTRASDGTILDVNRAFEALTGWSRDEAVGRRTYDLGFWEDAQERERVARLARERGAVTGYEVKWINRRGTRGVGLLSIRMMEFGGEEVFNIVIRDITGRRRREGVMQTFSEQTGRVTGQAFFTATARLLAEQLGVRYAFVVEITPGPVGADIGRTLAAWNHGPAPEFSYTLPDTPCANVLANGMCHYPDHVAELFPRDTLLRELGARGYAGLPIRDHLGQTLGLVAVLDDKPMPEVELTSLLLVLAATRAAAELQRLRAEREITQLNTALETRVRERTAELAARVAEVERLNTEQQHLMRDLRSSQAAADRTAARLQEVNSSLLAANQELEAFSYSVSHDLRAPLRNMTGFLELLDRRTAGQLDPESTRFVEVIGREARRMEMLIDDLLTFSRIGRTEMRMQRVDLAALFTAVRDELVAAHPDRTIDWAFGPLPAVQGDPALLRQVVANLLDNAVKFTRRQPAARIEVGAGPAARGEGRVTIHVRDNGAGFNPLHLDKLFGVFQRLHSSRDYEGTGIGLANVKRIVTRHGGRIWAEGQVNRGATFYLTLAPVSEIAPA